VLLGPERCEIRKDAKPVPPKTMTNDRDFLIINVIFALIRVPTTRGDGRNFLVISFFVFAVKIGK